MIAEIRTAAELREITAPKAHFLTTTEKETNYLGSAELKHPRAMAVQPTPEAHRKFVILQIAQHLPAMHKALGSNPSITKKEKNEQETYLQVTGLHSQMST